MMSSDLAPHSADGISGYGMVFALDDYNSKREPKILAKLSEEHGSHDSLYLSIGWIKNEPTQSPLQVGMKVCIIPNHSCPTANLSDVYVVIGKEDSPITWNIIARGCVK